MSTNNLEGDFLATRVAGARDLVLALVMKFTIVCIQTGLILIFNFLERCGQEGEFYAAARLKTISAEALISSGS